MKGKAKEDFEKWYNKQNEYYLINLVGNWEDAREIGFNDLPFSMQSGVKLEFWDSVGLFIEVEYYFTGNWCSQIWFKKGVSEDVIPLEPKQTREEALKEAFKKAENIHNEKNN